MAGRPTNHDERYEQVMHALVGSVARYGLDGASLSQIAKEAGLSRPLIRHHLGNRDDIIASLADFVLKTFADQSDAMLATLPVAGPSDAIIEMLFSKDAASEPELILAFAALTARASDDPSLRERCRASLLAFEAAIAETLLSDHPSADPINADKAAHGIVALYLNQISLAPLDMPESWQGHARNVAQKLLDELDHK